MACGTMKKDRMSERGHSNDLNVIPTMACMLNVGGMVFNTSFCFKSFLFIHPLYLKIFIMKKGLK